ncbi:MAG: pentapeptide repeat-containing protein, partial [Moorea sp. SIO2I5]|nr:pentapeptide repeat-containing protein [Moorena sp. SIO2I5]
FCGTGILPVTIPGQARCPPHSYSFLDSAMPFFSSADLSDANLKSADLTDAKLNRAIVDNAKFGDNSGLDESIKGDLIKRGAMFEDLPGNSSESVTPIEIPPKNAIGLWPRYAPEALWPKADPTRTQSVAKGLSFRAYAIA